MFCPLCHQEYPDNARFCPYCGTAAAGLNPQHHLAAGTVLNGRYIVGTSLGEGGFGITYKGFDKLLQIDIAIKEYFPSGFANRSNTISNEVTPTLSTKGSYYNNGKERFLQEAQHLARFSRERSIVVVRDFFSENNTAYMVMEYIDGKTLFQCVREDGPFDAETLIRAFLPLMRSLEKMHSAGIIHRDISPDNVMMQPDGSLKLIDFGAARYLSGEETHTISVMLKPGYAPCEQYSRKGRQGAWTDVYALCATLYACILNRTPPDALDRMTSDDLKKPSELGVKLPPRAENVLLKGLAVQPQDRIQSMGELADELERAFQSSGRTAPYPLTGADKPPEWFTDGNNPEPNVTVEAKTDSAANIQPEMPAELPPSAQPPAVNTRPPKKPINVLLIGGLALAVIAIAAAAVIIFTNLSSAPAATESTAASQATTEPETVAEGTTVSQTVPQSDIVFQGLSDDCTWTIDNTGLLTVSGNGAMQDYERGKAPWYTVRASVKSIRFDSGVKYIGQFAFSDFDNLEHISFSDTVSHIGAAAFVECHSLQTVTIPPSVKVIDFNAFSACSQLCDIQVDPDNTVYSSENGNLYNKDKTVLILYAIGKTEKEYTVKDGVETVFDDAFERAVYLKEIALPDSVKQIGKWSFEYCTSLEKIRIPSGVASIGEDAFLGCSEQLVIYGTDNSTAKTYADNNNIRFSAY